MTHEGPPALVTDLEDLPTTLPSLPRFDFYDAVHEPQRLARPELTGISRFTPIGPDSDAPQRSPPRISIRILR